MNSPHLRVKAMPSLDNDLAEMAKNNQMETTEAILLQILRIMRGRPFNVDLQPKSEGHWSTDGKTWVDRAPGS